MSDGKRLGTSRAAVYMRNKRKLKRLFSTCGTKVSIPKNFFDTMPVPNSGIINDPVVTGIVNTKASNNLICYETSDTEDDEAGERSTNTFGFVNEVEDNNYIEGNYHNDDNDQDEDNGNQEEYNNLVEDNDYHDTQNVITDVDEEINFFLDDDEDINNENDENEFLSINSTPEYQYPLISKRHLKIKDHFLSVIATSIKHRRFIYPFNQCYGKLRTDDELISDMKFVTKKGVSRYGIKGYSALTALPLFSITKGVVVEAMHAAFLGAAKLHTTILMTTTNTSYYVGGSDAGEIIDKTLLFLNHASLDDSIASETKTYIFKALKVVDETVETGSRDKFIFEGKPTIRSLTQDESIVLRAAGYTPEKITIYGRMQMNKIKFSSVNAQVQTKISDSFIFNERDGVFYEIKKILSFQIDNNLISGLIVRRFSHAYYGFDTQFISAVVENKFSFIHETNRIRPAIKITTNGKQSQQANNHFKESGENLNLGCFDFEDRDGEEIEKVSLEENDNDTVIVSRINVKLREIFPNLENIDPTVVELLPSVLQQEARVYLKTDNKVNVKFSQDKFKNEEKLKTVSIKSSQNEVINGKKSVKPKSSNGNKTSNSSNKSCEKNQSNIKKIPPNVCSTIYSCLSADP
ncbi:hypothetical protein KQX54_006102 [Cotesia glomerata]|uniref:Uncharacterized protein n=1 Tax=Cotesia glomerata TaxID=32391 RepID=A0AAV7J358_COTGL|nr:hypothetical protein KQX54_006102 [Cotesia glomerata]